MIIYNTHNEGIDVSIEGKTSSDKTIVFVHGFATDKHETAGYFDDLAKALGDCYRIVRFDFTGCGNSSGLLEEKDYLAWAHDLHAVISFVKKEFPGQLYIIAQSMGTFVTALANPDGVEKTVFTGIPNADTNVIVKRMISRFGTRPGAVVSMQGVSLFPRSSGVIQRIGAKFWNTLENFHPVESVSIYAKRTKLLIIHPKQDEIIGSESLNAYKTIPTVTDVSLEGNHSWSRHEEREVLMATIKSFFAS